MDSGMAIVSNIKFTAGREEGIVICKGVKEHILHGKSTHSAFDWGRGLGPNPVLPELICSFADNYFGICI